MKQVLACVALASAICLSSLASAQTPLERGVAPHGSGGAPRMGSSRPAPSRTGGFAPHFSQNTGASRSYAGDRSFGGDRGYRGDRGLGAGAAGFAAGALVGGALAAGAVANDGYYADGAYPAYPDSSVYPSYPTAGAYQAYPGVYDQYGNPIDSNPGYAYGGAAAPGYADQGDESSVAYCERTFRSYDPATGTYLGYDGMRHACP